MRITDYFIKRSSWYQSQIEDLLRIKKAPVGLDVINFGSNPAKYGLDYSQCGMKGYNFSIGPQTLEFDYKMLKKYSPFLDENGRRILILLFCPFTCCKSVYTSHDGDVYKNIRYYGVLDIAEITNFDYGLYEKNIAKPSKQGVKVWRRILSRKIHKPITLATEVNPLSTEQMKANARNMIVGWMREFYLIDLKPNHLSHYVKEALRYNGEILNSIIQYCKENNIRPYFVIPPLSSELNELIPNDFRKACMYSILGQKDAELMDYSKDRRFCKHEFFVDALKLNKIGRIQFTNQLISDIMCK